MAIVKKGSRIIIIDDIECTIKLALKKGWKPKEQGDAFQLNFYINERKLPNEKFKIKF